MCIQLHSHVHTAVQLAVSFILRHSSLNGLRVASASPPCLYTSISIPYISLSLSLSYCSFLSGLVMMSASCRCVGTHSMRMRLFLISSRMKWCLMSMCFVLWCRLSLWHMAMAAVESVLITAVCWACEVSSASSCLAQMISCVVLLIATYSASAVERDTVDCFLLPQCTRQPLIMMR